LASLDYNYNYSSNITSGSSSTTTPVFCSLTWSAESTELNQYPPTTPVFEYNKKRIASFNTTENPDLEYIRLLLADPLYPGAAGGIATKMARAFSSISNECEDFHGDISQCCSKANCNQNVTVESCLKDRCPGRILYEKGGSGHCECVYEMLNMGYVVDETMMFLCTYSIIDQFGSRIGSYLYSKISGQPFEENGCESIYLAEHSILRGPLRLQQYVPTMVTPTSPSFNYLQPIAGTKTPVEISWALENCAIGQYSLLFHYQNQGASKMLEAQIDDSNSTIPVSFPGNVPAWSLLSVNVPTISAGFHSLTLIGTQDQVPNLHYMQIKQVSQ